jgi:hypothetical protein
VISLPVKSDTEPYLDPQLHGENLLEQLKSMTDILFTNNHSREGEALSHVSSLATISPDFGGLGYSSNIQLDEKQEAEVLFLVSAWLEALNSADRSKSLPKPLPSRPEGRRGMTLSEKIFAAHDIEQSGFVTPGDVVRVSVDWIMASELSWGVSILIYTCVVFELTIKGYGTRIRCSWKTRSLSK